MVVVVVAVVAEVPLVLVPVVPVMLVSVDMAPVPDVSTDVVLVVLVPLVSVLIVPVVAVMLVSVEEVVVTVDDVSVAPVSVFVLFSCLQAKPKRPRAATVRKTRIVFFMLFPFCCFVGSGVIWFARAEVACLTSLLISTNESRARPRSRGCTGVPHETGSNTGATGWQGCRAKGPCTQSRCSAEQG